MKPKILAALKPLSVPLGTLKLMVDNPRRHAERDVNAISASLCEFGQRTPLVVNRNGRMILKGNGTFLAAEQLGWNEIAVVWVKDDATKAARYAIADNRTAELSTWNDVVLASILSDTPADDTLFDALLLDQLVAKPKADRDDAPQTAPPADKPKHYGASTSISRGCKPRSFWQTNGWLAGDVLDYGCGKDEHGFAKFDPFTQPDVSPLLRKWDVVMCNYVLQVQPSNHLVVEICALIRCLLKAKGHALFAVRSDLKTSTGSQQIKSGDEWAALIGQLFTVETVNDAEGWIGFRCTPRKPERKAT